MRADIDAFIEWFQSNGGTVDLRAIGITEFPGSGRGAVALCDIPVRSPLSYGDDQLTHVPKITDRSHSFLSSACSNALYTYIAPPTTIWLGQMACPQPAQGMGWPHPLHDVGRCLCTRAGDRYTRGGKMDTIHTLPPRDIRYTNVLE